MRAQAELGGLERVDLRHRVFRAVQAVEDELAEKAEADLAGNVEVLLALVVDEIDVVAGFLAADVDVFAQLDRALGAEDDGAAVAPRAQAVRGEPIDANVIRRPVVAQERGLAEILELGLVGVGVVGDRRLGDGGVGRPGEREKLLELVAADVAEDAAVFRFFEKPGRARRICSAGAARGR